MVHWPTTLLVLSLLAVPAAQTPGATATAQLAATVPDEGTVKLFAVDGTRLQSLATIPVGKNPSRMCRGGEALYVVTASGATSVNLKTRARGSVFAAQAAKSPFDCLVSADGSKLYVTDRAANAVFVFATSSADLLSTISVPEDPRQGIFTADGRRLVISCGDAGVLAVVDPASNKVVDTIKTIGLDPRDMRLTHDGKYLVVALVSSDILSWYDGRTLEYRGSFGVARSPQQMAFSPDGARIYVTGAYDGVIGIVDTEEHKADGTPEPRQANAISGVGAAYTLAPSDDGSYLYAAPTDGTGTIVDIRSWKMLKPPALKGVRALLFIPRAAL